MAVQRNNSSHNLRSQSRNQFSFPKISAFSWGNFDQWLTAINSLLEDIPALEVSTTIVEEITPEIFIPWEIYQNIYQISPIYLQERAVEPNLCDPYLDLRRRLELQYALLLVNPKSKLYNSRLKRELQADLPILAKHSSNWLDIPSRLPSPESLSDSDQKTLHQLLEEPQFLATLRQLGKLKDILDRKDLNTQKIASETSIDNKITPDITYAQTSIKIDGKIDNRYSQEILDLNIQQQENIIELHNKGILSGEKQWHQLFKFVLIVIRDWGFRD